MDTFEDILHDLAKLQIGDRQILGDLNEVANGVRANAADAQKQTQPSNEVIVIGSDDENALGEAPADVRPSKAVQIAKLTRVVSESVDNIALAQALEGLVEVLRDSRSRSLTKEGFAFLDALYKQLADPSVYIQPMRTSRPRNSAKDSEQAPRPQPRYEKMNKLWNLKRDVTHASSNKMLAELVAEFGAVINRSTGRTITKDAFGFLDGLAERLRELA